MAPNSNGAFVPVVGVPKVPVVLSKTGARRYRLCTTKAKGGAKSRERGGANPA